jgi:hypothetical protein
LYKKPVLIERGSFRPVTNVTLEMLDRAWRQLQSNSASPPQDTVFLMEMTLNNLMSGRAIDHQDFLARVDILGALNKTVMISNYSRFDRVTGYLRNYTQNWIAMVVGVPTLREIFEPKYYAELEGGILEGLGRLFMGSVRLFVYPTVEADTGELTTADKVDVSAQLKHLYAYLFENGFVEPIRDFDATQLNVTPAGVLAKIETDEPGWRDLVPAQAAELIAQKGLFGFSSRAGAHT